MVMIVNNSNDLSHASTDNDDKSFQQYNLDGLDFKIVLSGDKTEGRYSLLEMVFSAEKENEIPLHLHSRETLIIYILEGNFSFRYGDEKIDGIQGTVLKFEKDIPHSYKKTGKSLGRLLILFIPAGFDKRFVVYTPHFHLFANF